ncbi:MAG: hypothetical protein ACO3MW_08610, partial [Rhodospirillales bacterium]
DRRFNPRPTSFVFQHLNSFMSVLNEDVELLDRQSNEAGSVCSMKAGDQDIYLLLPGSVSGDGLLDLIDPSSLLRKSGRAHWGNLETGELIDVSWKKDKDGAGIAIEPMPSLKWPLLLILS